MDSTNPSFDPHYHLVTSPIFSPKVQAGLRLLIGLYALVSVVFGLAWSGVMFGEADEYVYINFLTESFILNIFGSEDTFLTSRTCPSLG